MYVKATMTKKLSDDLFKIIKELKDENNSEGLGKLASAIVMFEMLGNERDAKRIVPDQDWTSTNPKK